MFVDTEFAVMPHGLILYAGSIAKWDPPYEDEPLDQNARYRIICNIQEYMSRKGFDIMVDTGRSQDEYLTPTWDQIRRENRPGLKHSSVDIVRPGRTENARNVTAGLFLVVIILILGVLTLPGWFSGQQLARRYQTVREMYAMAGTLREFGPDQLVQMETYVGGGPRDPMTGQPFTFIRLQASDANGDKWLLLSPGPTRHYSADDLKGRPMQYDPTNGTVSSGCIVFSDKKDSPLCELYGMPQNGLRQN